MNLSSPMTYQPQVLIFSVYVMQGHLSSPGSLWMMASALAVNVHVRWSTQMASPPGCVFSILIHSLDLEWAMSKSCREDAYR